jgi:polar amino acid transport system substrate-binding protein
VDQSTYHFGFLNPLSGQIEGFDIDMIRAVAKAIFGDPGKVQFKAISDEQRIPDTAQRHGGHRGAHDDDHLRPAED